MLLECIYKKNNEKFTYISFDPKDEKVMYHLTKKGNKENVGLNASENTLPIAPECRLPPATACYHRLS